MNKTKIEIYKKILRDVFQNFDGGGKFIKQRLEELFDWKKSKVQAVIYFFYL